MLLMDTANAEIRYYGEDKIRWWRNVRSLDDMLQILCVKVSVRRSIAMENSCGFSYNICNEVHLFSGSGVRVTEFHSVLTVKLRRKVMEAGLNIARLRRLRWRHCRHQTTEF